MWETVLLVSAYPAFLSFFYLHDWFSSFPTQPIEVIFNDLGFYDCIIVDASIDSCYALQIKTSSIIVQFIHSLILIIFTDLFLGCVLFRKTYISVIIRILSCETIYHRNLIGSSIIYYRFSKLRQQIAGSINRGQPHILTITIIYTVEGKH